MKKITIYCLLFCTFSLTAQQQPSTRAYGGWQTVYEEGTMPYSKKVQIAFSLNKCGKDGLIGYSFYKTNNEFNRENANLTFGFDYEDCDGKVKSQTCYVSLNDTGEDRGLGMWFLGYKVIGQPYIIKKPNSGNKSTTSNNSSNSTNGLDFPGENKEVEDLIKKGDQALAKNLFKEATDYYNQAKAKGGFVVLKLQDAKQKEIDYKKDLLDQEIKSNNTIANQQKENERKKQEITNNYARQLQETQAYIDRSNESYKQKSEIITQAFDNLRNTINDNYEKKKAREELADQRREEKRLIEKRDKELAQIEENERQAAREEANRQRLAREERERENQWNIDKRILGNFFIRKETFKVADNIKKVYYIVYERNYVNNQINIKTYSLNKYSDDSWMLQSDLLKKINFKEYFGNEGIGQLLGAYENKNTAIEAIKNIKANATNVKVENSFLDLNGQAKVAGSDSDFWKN